MSSYHHDQIFQREKLNDFAMLNIHPNFITPTDNHKLFTVSGIDDNRIKKLNTINLSHHITDNEL